MSSGFVDFNGRGIEDLQHPLMKPRFVLALIVAILFFPLIALVIVAGTVAFLIVPMIGFLIWLWARVYFANFMGNTVLVSPLNYPKIHQMGEELRGIFEYDKPVYIFVLEMSSFNAFLMSKLFSRKAIFLTSELLEQGVTEDELRWLIGRFVGYLTVRKSNGIWGLLIRSVLYIPFVNLLVLPYERAMVYTGDRLALGIIRGDISASASVVQKLLVGRQLGYSVNPMGLIDQQRETKGDFFSFLARMATPFPSTVSRYVDLICFARVFYPAQYARFEAENPGLPLDLMSLAARLQPPPGRTSLAG